MKKRWFLFLLAIPVLIIFGYFMGNNSKKSIYTKFYKFSVSKSMEIDKLFEISKLFVNEDSSASGVTYQISTRDHSVHISYYDMDNIRFKDLKINRDPFFLDLVMLPPSTVVIYKKKMYLNFKEVYTDFKGNAYSLIFFESNEARESFLSFQKKPVFENDENAEGDDYYAKLNNNCYVESISR